MNKTIAKHKEHLRNLGTNRGDYILAVGYNDVQRAGLCSQSVRRGSHSA